VTEVEVVPLPKSLIYHEHACTLAFQPPVHLHAAEGSGLASQVKK
jgi:hypothetical protein